MARLIPESAPGSGTVLTETPESAALLQKLAGELDDSWQIVRGWDERDARSSVTSFALLHRDYGIAVTVPGNPAELAERADQLEAAMRRRLQETGFTRRFPGSLPIVALFPPPATALSANPAPLSVRLQALFEAAPRLAITDPLWTDWLAPRLGPGLHDEALADAAVGITAPQVTRSPLRAPRAAPLRAPSREESWRVSEASAAAAAPKRDAPAMSVAAERIPQARDLEDRSPLLAGMGLAVLVVALVLIGMAALSNGNSGRVNESRLGGAPAQEAR